MSSGGGSGRRRFPSPWLLPQHSRPHLHIRLAHHGHIPHQGPERQRQQTPELTSTATVLASSSFLLLCQSHPHSPLLLPPLLSPPHSGQLGPSSQAAVLIRLQSYYIAACPPAVANPVKHPVNLPVSLCPQGHRMEGGVLLVGGLC